MLKILVTNRNDGSQQTFNLTKTPVILGRHNSCDVQLAATAISRRHAQILVNRELIEIEDLSSGNGTYLNNRKLAPSERAPLSSLDKIRIENFDIEVSQTSAGAKSEPRLETKEIFHAEKLGKFEITNPDIIEIKMIKRVLGALETDKTPSLSVVTQPWQDKVVRFDETVNVLTIGRDSECDLNLPDSSLSRKQAEIRLKWGNFVILDLQSKNGTFLNGERIQEERIIKDGDEIVFGSVKTIFKNPREFDFAELSKTIEDEKKSKAEKEWVKTSDTSSTSPAPTVKEQESTQSDISAQEDDKKEKPSSTALESQQEKVNSVPQETSDIQDEEPSPQKVAVKKRRFSTLEMTLLAIGGFIFLTCLVLLVVVLSV